MRWPWAVAAFFAGFGSPAFGQTWEFDARLTVGGGFLQETGAASDLEKAPLLDAAAIVQRTDVFQSGLSLTWRGEARLQRDYQDRPAFAGVLGACSPALQGCPSVSGGAAAFAPVSPATGLSAGGEPTEEDVFLVLEGASVALSGPWGEGIVGLDTGAAARLDARPPRLLRVVSATSATLDPSGLVTTRARNDVSGPAFKATFLSPRWVGFRLGGSYTPEADRRGADFDPKLQALGTAGADLEQIVEGAVSFDRRFRSADVRVRAALTATFAESPNTAFGFADYEAWGAGLEAERDGWIGGVRWLSSNNARPTGGTYEAFEFGLTRDVGSWRFGFEGGWSKDDLIGIEGNSWLVGARRAVSDNVDLGVGWLQTDVERPRPGFSHESLGASGLVVELSVRN